MRVPVVGATTHRRVSRQIWVNTPKSYTHVHEGRDDLHGPLVEVEPLDRGLAGSVGQRLHGVPHDVRHHGLRAQQARAALQAHGSAGFPFRVLLLLRRAVLHQHVGAQQGQRDKALLAQRAHEAVGEGGGEKRDSRCGFELVMNQINNDNNNKLICRAPLSDRQALSSPTGKLLALYRNVCIYI